MVGRSYPSAAFSRSRQVFDNGPLPQAAAAWVRTPIDTFIAARLCGLGLSPSLEAEAIRDAVPSVSGKLDPAMYGPGFQDFVIDKPEHSPHYEYQLHDPEDARSHRRTIYRFVVRSQQQPFLTTLDCADPSMQVEKRNETITPQQALALLNNRFMIAMSRHFAGRVSKLAEDLPGELNRLRRNLKP